MHNTKSRTLRPVASVAAGLKPAFSSSARHTGLWHTTMLCALMRVPAATCASCCATGASWLSASRPRFLLAPSLAAPAADVEASCGCAESTTIRSLSSSES
jgi:hypothetical protein